MLSFWDILVVPEACQSNTGPLYNKVFTLSGTSLLRVTEGTKPHIWNRDQRHQVFSPGARVSLCARVFVETDSYGSPTGMTTLSSTKNINANLWYYMP